MSVLKNRGCTSSNRCRKLSQLLSSEELTSIVFRYSFVVTEAGSQLDRFSILSTPEPVLGTGHLSSMVYGVDGAIRIVQPEGEERTYQVYNLKGQLVLSRAVRSSTIITSTDLIPGIYLVNDGQHTHKIILE